MNAQNFDDIRPYDDAEVPAAIEQLIQDPEFLDAIIQYRWGIKGLFGRLLKPVVTWALRHKLKKFTTVQQVQRHVALFLEQTLKRTSQGVSWSGLEQLDPKQSYLFICNHRDIAMDPALVNWCLHQNGFNTCRIAIGDNLLKKACVTILMRLNKSFIVRRSAKGPREMLKALSQLSAYISYSLQQGENIWIAQKEGRAKDGNDATDPAILKMFYMTGKQQGIEFKEYMQQLRIVPVSLSYEFDPCDSAKANELWQRDSQGDYQKGEFEDIDSIIRGITGNKGRIHVHFGQLTDSFETPEQLAQQIDQQIYQGYQLYPINHAAAGDVVDKTTADLWQQRLRTVNDGARGYLTAMYANPLKNQQIVQVE